MKIRKAKRNVLCRHIRHQFIFSHGYIANLVDPAWQKVKPLHILTMIPLVLVCNIVFHLVFLQSWPWNWLQMDLAPLHESVSLSTGHFWNQTGSISSQYREHLTETIIFWFEKADISSDERSSPCCRSSNLFRSPPFGKSSWHGNHFTVKVS